MYKNSLIFNGLELGEFGRIEKIERNVISGIELTTKEILNKDGALYYDNKLKPLTITFHIRLFDRWKIHELIDGLAREMYSKELKPLNYNGFKTWYDAILQDLGDPNLWRSEIALLQPTFFVPDPVARSKNRRVVTAQSTFKIDSSYPIRPILKINNVSNYSIKNKRTGEFIKVNLPSTQSITINSETEYVYNSQGRPLMKYLDWQSSFFDVYHGDELETTAPTTYQFYERYLYDQH